MPKVLTTASTISCGHTPPELGGKVMLQSSTKLRINTAPVLVKDDIVGKSISIDCGIVPSSAPSTKCTVVSSVSGGEARKLKVEGKAVILDTLKGETNGVKESVTPQTLLKVIEANQTKLFVERTQNEP